ncbi:MAG: Ni/Fe hydrogenase, partial [Spirochaetota bacterium]
MIYGYGNPGRQDDGVGNAVVDELEGFIRERYIPGVSFDSNYQLNIEDATVIYGKDLVIFVDATTEVEVEHFKVTRVQPDPKV